MIDDSEYEVNKKNTFTNQLFKAGTAENSKTSIKKKLFGELTLKTRDCQWPRVGSVVLTFFKTLSNFHL